MRSVLTRVKKNSWLILLLLLIQPFDLSAQTKNVHGTVTDNNGKPLQGITVNVKGTKLTKVTSEDGTYSICMNPESTVVSRFGDSKWNKILNNNECPKREQFLPESGLNLLEYICEKKVVMGIGGVSKG